MGNVQIFSGSSLTFECCEPLAAEPGFVWGRTVCRVPTWVNGAQNDDVLIKIKWTFWKSYSWPKIHFTPWRYDRFKVALFVVNVSFATQYRVELSKLITFFILVFYTKVQKYMVEQQCNTKYQVCNGLTGIKCFLAVSLKEKVFQKDSQYLKVSARRTKMYSKKWWWIAF